MVRIELTLPESYYFKLRTDADKFNLKFQTICNLIFFNTDLLKLKPLNFTNTNTISIRFNLNQKEIEKYKDFNDEKYNISNNKSEMLLTQEEITNLNNISDTVAGFFRTILINFLDKPPLEREIFLFKDTYDKIISAIDNRKKIKFTYHDKERIVDPYFITTVENHPFNIVYCYSNAKEFDVTFRLSKITKIEILDKKFNYYDKEKIEAKKLNFVLYEEVSDNNTILSNKEKTEAIILKEKSYPINILIKFDKDKAWMFEEITYNRPNKYIKISDINKLTKDFKEKYPDFIDIKLEGNELLYDINTSIIKAETYFPQFLDYFEVLYPESLRNYFKKRLTNALNKYK